VVACSCYDEERLLLLVAELVVDRQLQIAVAPSASAIRLGNTAPDSTKMRLV